jgi:uncharacterized protein YndB with AHSA1/START domain
MTGGTMFTHTERIYVAAPPGRVWAALTVPELTAQCLFGLTIESTWAEDGPIAYRGPWGDAVNGAVVALRPGRELVHSVFADGTDTVAAWVTWTLAGDDGVTLVTFRYDDPDARHGELEGTFDGWAMTLSNLKSVLETGVPLTAGG